MSIPTLATGHAIDLPVLLETRLLVQANSGGGKSYTLRRILEQTAPLVQQLIIDPEGEFATLREKFDYIIAAPHDADAVATPQTAALLARRLLESGVSAVLDIYDLKAHERQQFVRRFLDALVNAPRKLWHPVMVVLDEAHVFCPQTGSAEASSAVIDVATRGRKRGLCLVAATQRLSKLHKDTAAELLNKLIGRTGLDVDVKRAADELGMVSREALTALRSMPAGSFYAFGPALHPEPTLVTVAAVSTSHPKAGQRLMQAPPPASAKVRASLAKLADLQKDAEHEARTMDELRAVNAEQARKLRSAEARAQQAGVPEAEVARRIAAALNDAAPVAVTAPTDEARLHRIAGLARKIADECAGAPVSGAKVSSDARPMKVAAGRQPAPTPSAGLSGPEQRILDAIAWMESIGVPEPGQSVVAFLSGYSGPDNGAYKNPRGSLNQRGHVRYLSGSRIALSDSGRAIANAPASPGSLDDLHERVLGKLGGPEQRILQGLLAAYPSGVSNAELAVTAGYSDANNGAYKNPRGRLRTFGLIEYVDGKVRARDILFPEATAA